MNQRLENFQRSVKTLRAYADEPVTSQRDIAGIVHGFNFAFELSWKCLQDRIAELGYTERGPKPTLSVSLKAGLIPVAEEPVWAQMLEDRNLAIHTYNEQLAKEIASRVMSTHLPVLEEMVKRLT
jgi:nucleotidyltransferase substrate binding protein (TIGR01987 family)